MSIDDLKAGLESREWRLDNLYFIQDKAGNTVPFRMNHAQRRLLKNLHYLVCILKARQLGFSTFICLFILDALLFNKGQAAGMVDRTLDDAKEKIGKMKFAYEHLPEVLKSEIAQGETWTTEKLTWANGSSAVAGVSLRGGTYQFLHVSEFGKIAFKDPGRAKEIRTGAFNTVAPGRFIFVESTHEGGKGGDFYDLCRTSMEHQGQELTPLDFKFHFEPWYSDPSYVLDPSQVRIGDELKAYFKGLCEKYGIELTPEQCAWYAKKKQQQGADMLKEFPSTPDEAFQVLIEGAIYGDEISAVRARGRIADYDVDPALPIWTFWDLGMSDATVIWAVQFVGREIHFVDYYENNGQPAAHYVDVIRHWRDDNGYSFDGHYLPHDAGARERGSGKTYQEQLEEAGLMHTRIVPRTPDLWVGINHLRGLLPRAWFRKDQCARGIECLEAYRTPYNERLGRFEDSPLHDWTSHCADAARTFAEAHMRGMLEGASSVARESRRPSALRVHTGMAKSRSRPRVLR